MRIVTVLMLTFFWTVASAAPRTAKASRPSPKPAKAPEAFYVASCASRCPATGVKASWSDGWLVPDAKKLRETLERTCMADLRTAGCKRPVCACAVKLAAVPASQPASLPAMQPVASRLLLPRAGSNTEAQDSIDRRTKQSSKTKARGDDLPKPSETLVEVTP